MYQATYSIFASFWKELPPKDAFLQLWKNFPNWSPDSVIDFLKRNGAHLAESARTTKGFFEALKGLSDSEREWMKEDLFKVLFFLSEGGGGRLHGYLVFCEDKEWFANLLDSFLQKNLLLENIAADEMFGIFSNKIFRANHFPEIRKIVRKMSTGEAVGFMILVLDYWFCIRFDNRSDENDLAIKDSLEFLSQSSSDNRFDREILRRKFDKLSESRAGDPLAEVYLEVLRAVIFEPA